MPIQGLWYAAESLLWAASAFITCLGELELHVASPGPSIGLPLGGLRKRKDQEEDQNNGSVDYRLFLLAEGQWPPWPIFILERCVEYALWQREMLVPSPYHLFLPSLPSHGWCRAQEAHPYTGLPCPSCVVVSDLHVCLYVRGVLVGLSFFSCLP